MNIAIDIDEAGASRPSHVSLSPRSAVTPARAAPSSTVPPRRSNRGKMDDLAIQIQDKAYEHLPAPLPEGKRKPPAVTMLAKGESSRKRGKHPNSRPEKKDSPPSSVGKEKGGELQGFDDELVEMIINNIVDSGEKVTFNDIAGLEGAKNIVQELVIMPTKYPDTFTGLREAPKGLLLFGPPGTGMSNAL